MNTHLFPLDEDELKKLEWDLNFGPPGVLHIALHKLVVRRLIAEIRQRRKEERKERAASPIIEIEEE
jgi:hypothetical protein